MLLHPESKGDTKQARGDTGKEQARAVVAELGHGSHEEEIGCRVHHRSETDAESVFFSFRQSSQTLTASEEP